MSALLEWSRATVLSVAEFEVSWEQLGLGETPVQLDPPSPGRTWEERARVVADVAWQLQQRGLGDGRGPYPVLAERMRLLATGAIELDLRFRSETLLAAVAGCRHERCVLAVRQGGEIGMLELPAEQAPAALVELLGPVLPGPGRAVQVRAEVLDAARARLPAEPRRFVDELVWRGVDEPDALLLAGMCTGARHGGQFGATARRAGRRLRAPYVVGVHRTGEGCYRQVRRREAGHAVVTVAPVDARTLLDDLAGLAEAATNRP